MADIKLTAEHDLDLTNAKLTLTDDSNSESLAQRLKIRLAMFKGEWFLDTDFGIPYFQEIFVKGMTKDQLDAIFMAKIRATPSILALSSFSSTLVGASRAYQMQFTVTTTNGTQAITLVL